SETHFCQTLVIGEHAGRHIADFSSEFRHEFVQLLPRRFGTKRVFSNREYQELIQNKEYVHMNATRWVTLTEFIKHLGRMSIAHVDDTDEGWWVTWIDNPPKALAKQAATLQKERVTMSDEQRERTLIAEQIERAKGQEEAHGLRSESPPEEPGLKRDEGADKVVLSLTPNSSKLDPSSKLQPTGAGGLKLSGIKPDINPLKANPLKRPNALKSVMTSRPAEGVTQSVEKKRSASTLSAAERIILGEQERKRRRFESVTAY
ncbi:domain of Kin17 curved DNA-binding protein-domain-containing protein, partial [Pisolithus croceorrhizus]